MSIVTWKELKTKLKQESVVTNKDMNNSQYENCNLANTDVLSKVEF